ncbi:hypothetical protein CLAIMM_02436 [Cladophialophora immunda]|nr:hypothetical protein CLAIMM_02436 [Cladophialophora immunda]
MATNQERGSVSTLHNNEINPGAADHARLQDTSTSDSGCESPSAAGRQIKPELQALIDWLEEGKSDDSVDRINFPLPFEQYEQFKELGMVEDGKLAGRRFRFDYDGDDEILTIRMPDLRYDIIAGEAEDLLRDFIKESRKHTNPAIAAFASSVMSLYTSDLHYPAMISTHMTEHTPDLSFGSAFNAKYPTMVGEVANSQTTNQLQSKAKWYIQGSRGGIRTVLYIDVDYPGKKGARFSVWRAKFDDDGGFQGAECDDAVEIRSKDGLKNPEGKAGLVLSLEDFCAIGEVTDVTPLKSVTMTLCTDKLYDLIELAEMRQASRKAAWAK